MKFILDTDLGSDCDDAFAIGMLHKLCNKEDILAITHCTSNEYSGEDIFAINRFFERENLPIGVLKESGFMGNHENNCYAKELAEAFPSEMKNKHLPDAMDVWRKELAGQKDESVIAICIGPLKNIKNLFLTKADEYSELDGLSLAKQKIKKFVCMGGYFYNGEGKTDNPHIEYNIKCDIKSAQYFVDHWDKELVFVDFKEGAKIKTGKKLLLQNNLNNPITYSYKVFCEIFKTESRESWDPLTVYFALNSDSPLFKLSESGKIQIEDDGFTQLIAGNGMHYYLKLNDDAQKIENLFENIF